MKNKRSLNNAWFQLIDSFTSHWTRKDDTTLILYFDGVAGCDPQYWPMTKALCGPKATNGVMVSETFDRISGKTFVTVKEPLNVLEERLASRQALVDSLHGVDLEVRINELKQAIEIRTEHNYDVTLDKRELSYAVEKHARETNPAFDASVGE